MCEARYLLSIEELIKQVPGQEALFQRASFRVDEERREKAGRMGTARGQAACLGGGLLLQLAVGEAVRAGGFGRDTSGNRPNGDMSSGLMRYSVSELLERLEDLPYFPLAYRYGENGKPYFRDFPFYFNLSHSGDYVLCAISQEEVGADIQQHCGKNVEKIAGRFFSKQEAEVIAAEEACEEREKLFYRLWARKEAYGKLTGTGVGDVLEIELLPRGAWELQGGDSAGLDSAHVGVTVLPDNRCLLWEEFVLDARICKGMHFFHDARPTSGRQHELTAGFTAREYGIMKEAALDVERHPEDSYSIAFCRFRI